MQTPYGPKVPLEAQVVSVVVGMILLTILGIAVTRPAPHPQTFQPDGQLSRNSAPPEGDRDARLQKMETWMRNMLEQSIHERYPNAHVDMDPLWIGNGPNQTMEPYHIYEIRGGMLLGEVLSEFTAVWSVSRDRDDQIVWVWHFENGFDPNFYIKRNLQAPSFYKR